MYLFLKAGAACEVFSFEVEKLFWSVNLIKVSLALAGNFGLFF